MTSPLDVKKLLAADGPAAIAAVPPGMEAMILADMARSGAAIAYLVSDGQRLADLTQLLSFFAPDIPVLTLPGGTAYPMTACRRVRMSQPSGFRRWRHWHVMPSSRMPRSCWPPPMRYCRRCRRARSSRRWPFRRVPAKSSAWRTLPPGGAQRLRARVDGTGGRRIRRARRHSRCLCARRGGAGAARLFRRYAGNDPAFRPGKPAHDGAGALTRSQSDERSDADT